MAEVKHDWVPLEQISRELQLAVIAAEDQRFAEHHGFDMDAISSALRQQPAKRAGARCQHPQPADRQEPLHVERSQLPAQGIEAWFTLLMELGWDKSRILEVYLNIVEFGPGIYGAEAAARHYFGKTGDTPHPHEASLPRRRPAQSPGVIGSSPHPMCSSARPGSVVRWVSSGKSP